MSYWIAGASIVGSIGGSLLGGKSKAPEAPDQMALAKQQHKYDLESAQQNTRANRANQSNAGGSLNWEEGPNGQWSQTVNMSGPNQDIYNSAKNMQTKAMAQLSEQGDFKGPDQIEWNPNGNKEYGDAIYNGTMDRAGKQQARDSEALGTKLRQQGLQPGTAAYDRSMQNLMTSQGDVNSQAANQAYVQGRDQYRQDYGAQLAGQGQNYDQKMGEYNMPWEKVANAGALADSQMPSFGSYAGAQGAPAMDYMGAANQNYSNKLARFGANQAQKSSNAQAGGSIGGSFGSMIPSLLGKSGFA